MDPLKDGGTIAAVIAALMAIYTGVITPTLLYFRKQITELKTQLSDCHKEREDAILWRAKYESRLVHLERTALEGRVAASYDANDNLIINSVNVGMSRMFGYTRSELIGKRVEELISLRDRGDHLRNVQIAHKVLTNEIDLSGPESLANPKYNKVVNGGAALHKDGSTFSVTVELEPVLLQGGNSGWYAIINSD